MKLGHLQVISPRFHAKPFSVPKNYSTLNRHIFLIGHLCCLAFQQQLGAEKPIYHRPQTIYRFKTATTTGTDHMQNREREMTKKMNCLWK